MNEEWRIASECAAEMGANPGLFAGCTAGRLTVRELTKCFTGGSCFGPNNTMVRAVRELAGGKNSVINRPEQILGGRNSFFRKPEQVFGGRHSAVNEFFRKPLGGRNSTPNQILRKPLGGPNSVFHKPFG
jgi:hypothetical protein